MKLLADAVKRVSINREYESVKVEEIDIDDIIEMAMRYYLNRLGKTPLDMLFEVNISDDWKILLTGMISGTPDDVFKPFAIVTDDALGSPAKLKQRVRVLQNRTETVASVAGMLCSNWLNDSEPPYTSDMRIEDAKAFIEDMIT